MFKTQAVETVKSMISNIETLFGKVVEQISL